MGRKAQVKEWIEWREQKTPLIRPKVRIVIVTKWILASSLLRLSTSRDNSVGHPWSRGSINGEGKIYFVLYNVQIGSEALSASYAMGRGGRSGKVQKLLTHPRLVPKLWMVEIYFHSLNVSTAWCLIIYAQG
jgi:hypothetical protein